MKKRLHTGKQERTIELYIAIAGQKRGGVALSIEYGIFNLRRRAALIYPRKQRICTTYPAKGNVFAIGQLTSTKLSP